MVWIHGGGYTMGGDADKRYNLTFLVENSVSMGKPMIAVSMQCKSCQYYNTDGLKLTMLHRPSDRLGLFGRLHHPGSWVD